LIYFQKCDDVQNHFVIIMQIYEINVLKSLGSNITAPQTPTFKHVFFSEVPSSC
jgi:hypothetical protein